jgi:hypothetical protein
VKYAKEEFKKVRGAIKRIILNVTDSTALLIVTVQVKVK